jgi:hypothetical protein
MERRKEGGRNKQKTKRRKEDKFRIKQETKLKKYINKTQAGEKYIHDKTCIC